MMFFGDGVRSIKVIYKSGCWGCHPTKAPERVVFRNWIAAIFRNVDEWFTIPENDEVGEAAF